MNNTPVHITPEIRDPDDLLRAGEAARLLGVSRSMVYVLRDEEGLPFVQVGKRAIRFRRGDLIAWAAERRNVVGEERAS